MPDHTFMSEGEITISDLERLIKLTEDGALSWRHSLNSYAVNGHPASQEAKDDREVLERLIGVNLKGARMGWNPHIGDWHFLRLTDNNGQHRYVEDGSPKELMDLGDKLFPLVRKADRLGGTLKSEEPDMRYCESCEAETEHKHLHDAPHGIQGATMGGSERYTCVVCETSVPAVAHSGTPI